MQIIIEGPDGSGKTTLINKLAQVAGWKIIPGKGPEKYPGEMMERIQEYLKWARYNQGYSGAAKIYDRHPCVSHPIYSKFNGTSVVCQQAADKVYELKHVAVYCRPPDSTKLIHPQEKEHDVGLQLAAITNHHADICSMYEEWALKRAHLIHRYWDKDSTSRTISAIIALAGE